MQFQLYNPFENMNFDVETCFLSGVSLSDLATQKITVFPQWIIERFQLDDKRFKLMNSVSAIPYSKFYLPACQAVIDAMNKLDDEIQKAFNKGYDKVKELPEEKLFLWSARMIYGVLYHDLKLEQDNHQRQNSEFKLSHQLSERFALFHLMIQALITPINFGQPKPWSIVVVKLKYSKDIFNYYDDTVRLVFTLGLNDLGIIAIMQDGGFVKRHEQPLLNKINTAVLHPIQFEELKARFIYYNYLLQIKPCFDFKENKSQILINTLPHAVKENTPVFASWDDNMFADVLTEFWKPWGFQKKDIRTAPNAPISFLENERTYAFISPESIDQPF